MRSSHVLRVVFLVSVFALFEAPWLVCGADTSVTGYNTVSQWGPTGVGVASDRVVMTVDLVGGSCVGSLTGKGDIVSYNGTSQLYFVSGTGVWDLRFSGSYLGGLSNEGSGQISGSITGSYDGQALSIGVSGAYNLAVDAPLGVMGVEMYLVYSNKPADLSYDSYMVRYMSFQPVSEIGGIDIVVDPGELSISRPGTYGVTVTGSLVDGVGAPVEGGRIDFTISSQLPVVQLPSGLTNQNGESVKRFYVTVPELSVLPQTIMVSASEAISGAGVSNVLVLSPTVAEVEVTGVSGASLQGGVWLSDVNNLVVEGMVSGLSLDSVVVSVDVEGDGSYSVVGKPSVDAGGGFEAPLSLYTAGSEYRITVSAVDDSGLAVADTFTVRYLGPSLVEIVSVDVPAWVDPKLVSSFDVELLVKSVSVEPTVLTVDLSMGNYYDEKQYSVDAGDYTYQIVFTVPLSQVQPVSYRGGDAVVSKLLYVPDLLRVTPVQRSESDGGLLIVIETKTDNGSTDTETTNGPVISETDIGCIVEIKTRLPYPEDRGTVNDRFPCETRQWSRMSRHSNVLSDMVDKRQTYPQWINALGVGYSVEWRKVGNVDFEVVYACIEFVRQPMNFVEAQTFYVNQGGFMVSGNSQAYTASWGRSYDVPSGEYKVRVTYRVQYTVNGEVVEEEFQRISADSFFVKQKRVNPCDLDDFSHQTLYEEKVSVDPGRTEFRLEGQGDRGVGGFDPGASVSGVGGLICVPGAQTFALLPVQVGGSVTLYLDWSDAGADLDLMVIDPLGRSCQYLYEVGLVVNGIPGLIYSGNGVKPEWVRFEDVVEGEYLVSAYAVKAGGPVDAWFSVGESVDVGELVVVDHSFGSGISLDGELIGAGFIFETDDVVFSKVSFENIDIGSVVSWRFEGPGGVIVSEETVMEYGGEAFAFAYVNMGDVDKPAGPWSVSVYVDDVEGSVSYFLVNPLGDVSTDTITDMIPGFTPVSILVGLVLLFWFRLGDRRLSVRLRCL